MNANVTATAMSTPGIIDFSVGSSQLELQHESLEVLPTSFDLDLQSQASYGHCPYMCKRSRSNLIRFKTQHGNKRTNGQTDGADCIT